MAAQLVYACDIPFDANGQCKGNTIEFAVDSNLADALNNHAVALQANTDAMNQFFTLSVDDVSLISALMLATFITGNSIGKAVSLMRKA